MKNSEVVEYIASKSGLRKEALGKFISKNKLNAEEMAQDIGSKKLNPMDLNTAVVGKPNNIYAMNMKASYGPSGKKANNPKTYTKTHKSKIAADGHSRKIKARGGTVTRSKVNGGTKLTYKF